ncbi:hypothetical protein ACLOJK_003064 [Asimina triloba]
MQEDHKASLEKMQEDHIQWELEELVHYAYENELLSMVNQKVLKISSSLEKDLMEINPFVAKKIHEEIEEILTKWAIGSITAACGNEIGNPKRRIMKPEQRNAQLEK